MQILSSHLELALKDTMTLPSSSNKAILVPSEIVSSNIKHIIFCVDVFSGISNISEPNEIIVPPFISNPSSVSIPEFPPSTVTIDFLIYTSFSPKS